MLVAEAPQAMGRSSVTLAAADPKPIAFGGFSTQSRADLNAAQSRGAQQAASQSAWDEDRVIAEPAKVVASVTETSSITEQAAEAEPRKTAEAREAPEAIKSPNARLAAAAYEDDAQPRKAKKVASKSDDGDTKSKKKVARNDDDDGSKSKKKVARKSDDDEGRSERRRSQREVASYEERRSYRAERDYQYSSRYAQVERNYGSGGNSDGGRSAGQLMSDNLRPL
jgi:hypothetical protein